MPEIEDVKPLAKPAVSVEKLEDYSDSPRKKLAQAKRMREEIQLPPIPSTRLTGDQMVEYFKLLTDEMIPRIDCYLYRVRPIINNQMVNPKAPKYIDKVKGGLFSLEEIQEKHGGGTYSAEIYDRSVNAQQALFKAKIICTGEPKLDIATIDCGESENTGYILSMKAKGYVVEDGKLMERATEKPAPQGADMNAVLGLVKEMFAMGKSLSAEQIDGLKREISKQTPTDPLGSSIGAILLEKMKQDDPSNTMKMMVSMVEAMTKVKEPVSTGTAEVAKLYEKMMESQKQTFELVLGLVKEKSGGEGTKSKMEEMREMVEFADTLAERRGNTGGGKRDVVDKITDVVERVALPVLENITKLLMLKGGMTGSPVGNGGIGEVQSVLPPAPVNAHAFNPYTDAHPRPDKVVEIPSPSSMQPSTPVGPEGVFQQVMAQYGGMVIGAINAGKPGWEFAEDIIALMGKAPVEQIKVLASQLSPENPVGAMVGVLRGFQEFAMFSQETLSKWVEEFLNWENYGEEEGERS